MNIQTNPTIVLLNELLSDNSAARGRLLAQHPDFFNEYKEVKSVSTQAKEGTITHEGRQLKALGSIDLLQRDLFKEVKAEWVEAVQQAKSLPVTIAKAIKKLERKAAKADTKAKSKVKA